MRPPPRLLAALGLGPLLAGCAAALIPVAAGGLGAGRHLHRSHRQGDASGAQVAAVEPTKAGAGGADPAPSPSPSPAPVAAPGDPAAPAGPVAPAPAPAPADLAQMRPGQTYIGALPSPASPTPTAPPVAPDGVVPASAPGAPAVPTAGWRELPRYVADRYGHWNGSVLLARGSTLAAPRWVPCADKPAALLVDLDAVVPARGAASKEAAEALGAAETLETTIIYVTGRTGPDLAAAAAPLRAAGLHPPKPGETMLTMMEGQEAATRAAVGARWCIVALIGDWAADFPNSATPESAGAAWNSGWFLVPAAAPGG